MVFQSLVAFTELYFLKPSKPPPTEFKIGLGGENLPFPFCAACDMGRPQSWGTGDLRSRTICGFPFARGLGGFHRYSGDFRVA
jgi:hypothetical protein